MTVDLADLPWDAGTSQATRNGSKGRRCQRHEWRVADGGGDIGPPVYQCLRCNVLRDPAASRRGLSARRLGGDQERRIERVYGPRKVGEYGDPVDHLGRDFKWQAKSTRSLPPKWLAAITAPTWRATLPKAILDPMAHMTGIGGVRIPLVIRSFVRQGVATRDWLFLPAIPWLVMHGDPLVKWEPGYMVIPGADFLELHGRDEE